jgi:hypothetical protein
MNAAGSMDWRHSVQESSLKILSPGLSSFFAIAAALHLNCYATTD